MPVRQSIPRIGKVTLKNGTTVHPLHNEQYADWRGKMIQNARDIAGHYRDNEMTGYVVFAWNDNGDYSISFQKSARGAISSVLVPEFIADAVRRNLVECNYGDG